MEGFRYVSVDEDVDVGNKYVKENRWTGGRRSNYVSDVDDNFLEDDIYHSAHSIPRDPGRATNFVLRDCV